LYHLLSNPKYFEPLRQEIEAAIAEEGWTKAGMDKLHKLDSVLRETQRMNTTGIGLLGPLDNSLLLITLFQVVVYRLALRPFTFSNGVTIPKGTIVSIPASAIHMDENIYSNPEQFDGFRFSKARDMGGAITTIHSAVSTSPEYLAFGLGRHTW
jgi:cytochrome P450